MSDRGKARPGRGGERDAVIAAAHHLRAMVDRVVGPGDGSSWLDQLAAHGQLPHAPSWTAAEQQAAADLLAVLGERLRTTRAVTGSYGYPASGPPEHRMPLDEDHGLPLNRKERYYTGTVLPMVIASDDFAHLHRFLELCELPAASIGTVGPAGAPEIQFFTEYSFAESVVTAHDRNRFTDRPLEADTPDIVMVGRGWLVAVEAKIFHRPSRQALEEQVRRQRVLVDYWAHKLGVQRVRHVLLLPAELATARPDLSVPVVTLEQVVEAYALVGPTYWVEVLGSVLTRYPELSSPEPTFRTNADALLAGGEIVSRFDARKLEYGWVGRRGGLDGAALREDLRTGSWHDRSYEVRRHVLPSNPNWFAVADFVTKVRRSRFHADGGLAVSPPPAREPGSQGSSHVSLHAADKRYLDATLEDDGAVVLRGQDLSSEGEYEYAFWIQAKHVPRLRSALGGKPGDPILDLLAQHGPEIYKAGEMHWLEEHRIPAEFWSRVE